MPRSHRLVVPESPLEIHNYVPVFGEASDLVERPKEWVNRWSYLYKGAQSPVITNAPVHGWLGITLVFSAIKFQGVGIFQCIFCTIPVYLITESNYIGYVVMLLSMPIILLYLAPQVCLKLVHWI